MTPRFMNRKVVIEPVKEVNAPVFTAETLRAPSIQKHRAYPVFYLGELMGYLYRNAFGNHAWVFHPVGERLSKHRWHPTLFGPGLSADEAKRVTMALVASLTHSASEKPMSHMVRLFSCQWCGGDHAVRFNSNNDSTYVGSHQCWHCGTNARAYTRVI